MAYADQGMTTNRLIAIVFVALIHLVVGYALVTGLAYSAAQKLVERVTTVDIEEPPPPEEEPPPPPPPDQTVPPPVAPPPPISISVAPPPIQTVQTIPPPAPPVRIIPPQAPPAPPAPPPPRFTPKAAEPRGNPGSWATTDDYPARSLRNEEEGVTRFRLTIDTNGRVSNCEITGSSGSSALDEAACRALTRRGRFNPATDGNGQPTTGTYSNSVRWQIPR